jgi:soluble lytic murein transglycosylase-like protein
VAALKAIAGALLLLVSPAAHAQPMSDEVWRWSALIAESSVRFGIPRVWIERVMRAESGGRLLQAGRPITSKAGAMGLMQLMPATWAEMRTRLSLGNNPHDPRDNILAGTAYLRLMYDRFGYPGLFAAYNAGPARYADYLANGKPLPAETRAYLGKISGMEAARNSVTVTYSQVPITARNQGTKAPETPAPDPLFAIRHDRISVP